MGSDCDELTRLDTRQVTYTFYLLAKQYSHFAQRIEKSPSSITNNNIYINNFKLSSLSMQGLFQFSRNYFCVFSEAVVEVPSILDPY